MPRSPASGSPTPAVDLLGIGWRVAPADNIQPRGFHPAIFLVRIVVAGELHAAGSSFCIFRVKLFVIGVSFLQVGQSITSPTRASRIDIELAAFCADHWQKEVTARVLVALLPRLRINCPELAALRRLVAIGDAADMESRCPLIFHLHQPYIVWSTMATSLLSFMSIASLPADQCPFLNSNTVPSKPTRLRIAAKVISEMDQNSFFTPTFRVDLAQVLFVCSYLFCGLRLLLREIPMAGGLQRQDRSSPTTVILIGPPLP